MPRGKATQAALIAIGANVLLLGLKALASGLSESLTIFSETLNSLADVVSAAVILACVRWAWKGPDEDHPFGHRRAEPIAGLLVAIFTGILGFEVFKTAALDLWHGATPRRIGPFPIAALALTGLLKGWLYFYFQRSSARLHSPALRAAAVDCRNDVFIALQGLIAVVVAEYRLATVDVASALVIGAYIIYSGHRVGMENLDYLMGRAPDGELLRDIERVAGDVGGVRGVVDVRGHYVGTFVHVELTAIVDAKLSTQASHDVCEAVRAAVEAVGPVDRAFVHIAPLDDEHAERIRQAQALTIE